MLQKKLLEIFVSFPLVVESGNETSPLAFQSFGSIAGFDGMGEFFARTLRGMFAPVSTIHFACLRHKTWDATRRTPVDG